MREIKFRAWDNENKQMLEVQELDYEDSYDGQPMIRTTKYNDYFDTEDMLLMQYTGLHDKNGKEIYEGDIVKVRKYSSFETEVVKFDKGCFYAGMHYGSSTRTTLKLIQPKMTEVIGNIYENKELLNETDR